MSQEVDQLPTVAETAPEVAVEELAQAISEAAITTNGNATAEEQQQNHESIGTKIRRTSEKMQNTDEDFKRYSKDDLLKLKNSAIGRQQPTTIPDVCRHILKSSSSGHSGGGFMAHRNFNQENSLLPNFMKNMGLGGGGGAPAGGGGSNRPYRGRSSLKREPNTSDEPDGTRNIIKIQLNVNEEVKLKESANAWRPRHLLKAENADPEEAKTQELLKKFRSCLNKLTPENFGKIVEQVKGFTINTEERLDGCIKLVFEKAISEPNFTDTYAQMCKELGTAIYLDTSEKKSNFKRKLVTQCQTEFQKHQQEKDQNTEKQELNKNSAMSPEEVQEKQLELEEQELKIRRRALGE
jgi:translation initiation factor 4G